MNYQNAEQNQMLRTLDLLSLFFLLFIVGCSIAFVLSRRGDHSRAERAVGEMRLLSAQILDQSMSASRSLASTEKPALSLHPEGRISKDPWGHPYYYRVLQKEGGHLGVIVWSSGPDGIPETREWDLRMGSGRGALAINYRGDDMGYFAE